ncbi:uncharacterized protein DSM5745_01123 [Aspergillus mulundensis]|uniref:Rhodopsin domain-containing protein n=1 Tax=Aspergillus mulundensis TaxID=1810919 RepID=A0A3D8T5T8_9EURO|nr:hypothetical protein DSM5745_01123 [Aspergillus mulundensis]RDW93801.1 hypothetical protein DSM5745_01123 [Aspergillus mulundensis]
MSTTDLNHLGHATVVVTILFIVLTGLAVGLRLSARRVNRAPLGWDDWFIILSTVLYFGFCANGLVSVYTFGGGQQYADPQESQRKYVAYMKSTYAVPPLYAITVTPIKLSMCFLYRRIFPVHVFRLAIYTIIAVCMAWFVAVTISSFLYCIPIEYFWDKTVDGHCFNFSVYFLVAELLDMLIDAAIIGLPIPTVLRLHMSLRKRLALASIFLLSTFILVVGTIRIIYLYNPSDDILPLARAVLWSTINLGVAIICACLPTYPPILVKFGSAFTSLRSRLTYGSKGSRNSIEEQTETAGTTTRSLYGGREKYRAHLNNSASDIYPLTQITVGKGGRETAGIRVDREIDMDVVEC